MAQAQTLTWDPIYRCPPGYYEDLVAPGTPGSVGYQNSAVICRIITPGVPVAALMGDTMSDAGGIVYDPALQARKLAAMSSPIDDPGLDAWLASLPGGTGPIEGAADMTITLPTSAAYDPGPDAIVVTEPGPRWGLIALAVGAYLLLHGTAAGRARRNPQKHRGRGRGLTLKLWKRREKRLRRKARAAERWFDELYRQGVAERR